MQVINCQQVNYQQFSDIMRVEQTTEVIQAINSNLPQEIINILNDSTVLSGSSIMNILLKMFRGIDLYPYKEGELDRLGNFSEIFYSFANTMNKYLKKKLITMKDMMDMVSLIKKERNQEGVVFDYDIYTNNFNNIINHLHSIGFVKIPNFIIDPNGPKMEFNIGNKYSCDRFMRFQKDNIFIDVISVKDERHPFYFIEREFDFKCCKVCYDGKNIYSSNYGGENSLEKLFDLSLSLEIIPTSTINARKALTTFIRILKYILRGFTYYSDDNDTKNLYTRFISSNYDRIITFISYKNTVNIYQDMVDVFFEYFNFEQLQREMNDILSIWDKNEYINHSYLFSRYKYFNQFYKISIINRIGKLISFPFITIDQLGIIPSTSKYLVQIIQYLEKDVFDYGIVVLKQILLNIVRILFYSNEEECSYQNINIIIHKLSKIKEEKMIPLLNNFLIYRYINITYSDFDEKLLKIIYFLSSIFDTFDYINYVGYRNDYRTYRKRGCVPGQSELSGSTIFNTQEYTNQRFVLNLSNQTEEIRIFKYMVQKIEEFGVIDIERSKIDGIEKQIKNIRICVNFYNFRENMFDNLKMLHDLLLINFENINICVLKDQLAPPFWFSGEIIHEYDSELRRPGFSPARKMQKN